MDKDPFNFKQWVQAKQDARDADARARISGEKSPEQLHRENAWLGDQPFRICWERMPRFGRRLSG